MLYPQVPASPWPHSSYSQLATYPLTSTSIQAQKVESSTLFLMACIIMSPSQGSRELGSTSWYLIFPTLYLWICCREHCSWLPTFPRVSVVSIPGRAYYPSLFMMVSFFCQQRISHDWQWGQLSVSPVFRKNWECIHSSLIQTVGIVGQLSTVCRPAGFLT